MIIDNRLRTNTTDRPKVLSPFDLAISCATECMQIMVTVHDLALSKNNPLYGLLCRGSTRDAVAIRLSLMDH